MFKNAFLFLKLPLLVSTWAVIALCFTASQLQAFPTPTNNPPAPPGTSPTSSSTLNNVTSTWRFSCTEPALLVLEINVFCEVNFFFDEYYGAYYDGQPTGTLNVTGRVLGGEVLGNEFRENRKAIWDVNIDIQNVKQVPDGAAVSVVVGESTFCRQTFIYEADFADSFQPAILSGSYTLNEAATKAALLSPLAEGDEPDPFGPPTWSIDVRAQKGVTNCLFTGDPSDTCNIPDAPATLTFPGGEILGQQLVDNQVLRYEETQTVPDFFCNGGPQFYSSYEYSPQVLPPVPGPYLITRFCHDADLGIIADVTCLREEGGLILSTTGDFDSLTLAKPAGCNDGPLAGTVQVETGFSEVTLVSTNLDCMAVTNSEASGRFPFAGADPVPVVEALEISAGSTVVSRIVTGFGVNTDPNDVSFRNLVLRRFIDGDEELRFRLAPPLGNEPANRFIAVSADYFVGWKKTQKVVITGKLNGQVVDTRTVIAEALPGKLKSARMDTVFKGPVDEIVFSTGPGNHGGRSIYGLRNPTFATAVVEAQP